MPDKISNVQLRALLGKIGAGTPLTISGATNVSPIVVTTTTHSLSTGDKVVIAGVAGNTAANGAWNVTVVTATTFSLDGSTGNGAYTSGGTATRLFSNVTVADVENMQAVTERAQHDKSMTMQSRFEGLTAI